MTDHGEQETDPCNKRREGLLEGKRLSKREFGEWDSA